MEDIFKRFYSTLDKKKFKYFVRENGNYVYGTDIGFIPEEYLPKDRSSHIKIENIEPIIRHILTVQKIPVEEYKDFELTRTGHPSNYNDFMDLCITDTVVPTICAIKIKDTVRFSYIHDFKILTTEYKDDDLYSVTYSLVNTYNCTEMLFDNPMMERIAMGWGLSSALVKEGSTKDMLNSYLKKNFDEELFERQNSCIVDIKEYDLPEFICETKQGKRLLEQWMRAPCVDVDEINMRLDLTECFSMIKLDLKAIGDLKRIIFKILNRRINIQEIIKVYQLINQIPCFITAISEYYNNIQGNSNENISNGRKCNNFESMSNKAKYLNEKFINPLSRIYENLQSLTGEIENKIDFNTSRINPNLSEKLLAFEARKIAIYKEIEQEFMKVKKTFPKVKFFNKSFKISRNEYNSTGFENTGFLLISISKTGVTFTTKNLSLLKNDLEEIESKIENEESSVLNELRGKMGGFVNSLEIYNFIVSLMDVYKCFSKKTVLSNYSRPEFTRPELRSGKYSIEGLFHPLLENKDCILNSITFDRNLCILTGPNMGGKSTFLKSLGIISLYAQIGCYVPARRACIPVFDRIFLRVGARDCSSLKLSTFMVEMTELNKIVRTATPNSLILIDELGRGTSAIDGLSLILAIKEYLINMGAFSVMATHFSEVGDSTTLNKKMSVSNGLLTYKITDGICDTSFGLNVAELAHFPSEVIESIKNKLGK